jgi:hypothetical protein
MRRLGERLNELAGVAKAAQHAAIREFDRIEKELFPTHRGSASLARNAVSASARLAAPPSGLGCDMSVPPGGERVDLPTENSYRIMCDHPRNSPGSRAGRLFPCFPEKAAGKREEEPGRAHRVPTVFPVVHEMARPDRAAGCGFAVCSRPVPEKPCRRALFSKNFLLCLDRSPARKRSKRSKRAADFAGATAEHTRARVSEPRCRKGDQPCRSDDPLSPSYAASRGERLPKSRSRRASTTFPASIDRSGAAMAFHRGVFAARWPRRRMARSAADGWRSLVISRPPPSSRKRRGAMPPALATGHKAARFWFARPGAAINYINS